jgi:hypothetical protein
VPRKVGASVAKVGAKSVGTTGEPRRSSTFSVTPEVLRYGFALAVVVVVAASTLRAIPLWS